MTRPPQGIHGSTRAAALTGLAALVLLLVTGAASTIAMSGLVEPKPLPGILGAGGLRQRQTAESLLYVATLVVLAPLAVVAGERWARVLVAARGRRGAFDEIALWGLAAAAPICGYRVLAIAGWARADGLPLLGLAAWASALGVRLVYLQRGGPTTKSGSGARTSSTGRDAEPADVSTRALVALEVAALGLVLAFARSSAFRWLPMLVCGLTVAGLLTSAACTKAAAVPASARRSRRFAAITAAAFVLAGINLHAFVPGEAGAGLSPAVYGSVVALHASYLVGPANQLVHGGRMLVDTVSQYGVAGVIALAAWFRAVGGSIDSLAIFDGVLTSLALVAGWLLLWAAGVRLGFRLAALSFFVVVLAWGRTFPVGTIVQDGFYRFGLPLVLICAVVLDRAGYAPRWATRTTLVVTLAVSAVWSLETFALTTISWFAFALFELAAGECRSAALRYAFNALRLWAACVALGHLALVAYTIISAGELPRWSLYLAFLRAFLAGDLSELTYDFAKWSPGVALGAAYVAQATVLAVVARDARHALARDPSPYRALFALSTYGLGTFYYMVDRSLEHVIVYVAHPFVLSAAIWLELAARTSVWQARRDLRLVTTIAVCVVSSLAVAAAWPRVVDSAPRSLGGRLLGAGDLGRDVRLIRDFPPVDPSAGIGAVLLRRFFPETEQALVLGEPVRTVETLLRAGKRNRLPLSFSISDSYVAQRPGSEIERLLQRYLADLRAGDRLMVDERGLSLLTAARHHRSRSTSAIVRALRPDTLRALALRSIGTRFGWHRVASAGGWHVLVLSDDAGATRRTGVGHSAAAAGRNAASQGVRRPVSSGPRAWF
ncbi:hypothetical protein [Thermoleophilum album]|uniref:Uncharacterized protein n=1 Tax=Thermoleophilum album TaxID=29539 RepID=A0A1H6FKE5_THEAL|nr:hypothetical protein [Thermoleophilum album]SEH10264.1 hypothetical protein SAMN02745716_0113 [Thermoleophilum album]